MSTHICLCPLECGRAVLRNHQERPFHIGEEKLPLCRITQVKDHVLKIELDKVDISATCGLQEMHDLYTLCTVLHVDPVVPVAPKGLNTKVQITVHWLTLSYIMTDDSTHSRS